MDCSWLVRVR